MPYGKIIIDNRRGIYYTNVMDNNELDFAIWWSDMKNGNPDLWIFELYCVDGWNLRELAKAFGTSRVAVKNKLRRARRTIARYFIGKRITVRRTAENDTPQKEAG